MLVVFGGGQWPMVLLSYILTVDTLILSDMLFVNDHGFGLLMVRL